MHSSARQPSSRELRDLTDRLLATYRGAVSTREVRAHLAFSCAEVERSGSGSGWGSGEGVVDVIEAMTRRRLTDLIAVRRIA